MTLDYYLSMASIITGAVTKSPILLSIPTAFRLTASFIPKLFPMGLTKIFTKEEQEKLDRIKNLLPAIRQDLGIKDSTKINLRVSRQLGANACMIGTTSSLGGPVLCLGNDYFKNYEFKSNDKNENGDFCEWLTILRNMPNTPSKLGKYIDGCSAKKRARIKELAKKFKDILSKNELEATLAHELGHAKHHHILKSGGLFLLALIADDTAQLFANSIGFGDQYFWASFPLIWLTIDAISRSNETEADGECASAVKYQQGMAEFHKKYLINDLFEKKERDSAATSFETDVAAMTQEVELFSSHPNSAKRLQYAVKLLETKNHPKTAMTKTAWALVGLGVAALAYRSFSHFLNITDKFFPDLKTCTANNTPDLSQINVTCCTFGWSCKSYTINNPSDHVVKMLNISGKNIPVVA